jgi:hypothetical protein
MHSQGPVICPQIEFVFFSIQNICYFSRRRLPMAPGVSNYYSNYCYIVSFALDIIEQTKGI